MNTVSSFESVIDRLKKSLKIKNDYELAELLNMKATTFNSRKKSGSLPFEEIINLANSESLDIYWIFCGDNSLEMPISKPVDTKYHGGVDLSQPQWDNFELIPMYTNVEASAGHGAVVYDEAEVSHLAFKREWLRNKGLQSGKLSLIRTRGDSMEPTLYDGDILLVDNRADRVIDDSIYIIQADQHLIVKRLQQAIDGSLLIISDNPRYEKQRLNPDQVASLKIAGRVCWYGHEI